MARRKDDPDRTADLIARAIQLEEEDAKAAGAVGFMARALVQATMPHRRTDAGRFVRRNGGYTLSMVAMQEDTGLPFGAMPRHLMQWIVTEAKRTGERRLVLGATLTEFLRKLGHGKQGGPRSPAARVKDQTDRLLSCGVAASYRDDTREQRAQFVLVDGADLWWTPVRDRPADAAERTRLWCSTLVLSERFFREIHDHGVPVDLRVLQDPAIRQSPLAIDLYAWLTHRFYTLSQPTIVPWESLRAQFGGSYADTPQGRRDFRRELLRRVRDVLALYPEANVQEAPDGLELRPSPTHVPPTAPRRTLPSAPPMPDGDGWGLP